MSAPRRARSLARALLLIAWLPCACATTTATSRTDPALPMLRAQGYRIAVPPFAVSAHDEDFLPDTLAPVGDLLALEFGAPALPGRDRLGSLLRQQVIGWLGQSDFEVIEPWATDTALAHRGLHGPALQDRAHAPMIAALLQVDGVLYGDVTRWHRSYYVVEARAEVGLRLELVDGATGRSLFATERIESQTSGLRGGPTGITSAATEPVAGLRGSHLRELSRRAARSAALDLAGGTVGELPEPRTAPRLSFVAVALPHEGPLADGDRIDVLALGTPGCEARFDLGALRRGVPLVEIGTTDDPRGARSLYQGHYVVQAMDRAAFLPVSVTIRGNGQNRASATRHRWQGSVSLGAEPAGLAASAPPVAR